MRSRLKRTGFLNFRSSNNGHKNVPPSSLPPSPPSSAFDQFHARGTVASTIPLATNVSTNVNPGGKLILGRTKGSSSSSSSSRKEGQILMLLIQRMHFIVGGIMTVIVAAAIVINFSSSGSDELKQALDADVIGFNLNLTTDTSAMFKGDDDDDNNNGGGSMHQQQTMQDITTTTPTNNLTSKPIFILHVGPPKTGSTTLQCTLESLRSELEKDSITYIGRPECHAQGLDIGVKYKKEFQIFEKALVTGYSCHQELIKKEKNDQNTNSIADQDLSSSSLLLASYPQCWGDFIDRLEVYRKEGSNVIFSDEAMSNRIARTRQYRPDLPYPWISLKSILEGLGWDVRVLIVHRPLYDYFPSVYVEQFKDGPNKVKLRRWYSNNNNGNTDSQCPSYGGRVIPRPFEDRTSEITVARLLDPKQKLYPTPAQVYELFRDYHFNIILVDMMEKKEGKDFIHHIICDHFPGTFHTCQGLLTRANTENEKAVSNSVAGARKLNPSLSLHYDFIAVEACQKGLINGTNIPRDVARKAIQFRQESDLGLSPDDFPLDCPDDTILKKLLSLSLDHERRLRNISDGSSTSGNWGLNESKIFEERFWKTVLNKKKLCTVNSKLVVDDAEWANFFPTIKIGE